MSFSVPFTSTTTIESPGNVAVVAVAGTLDPLSAEELRGTFDALVKEGHTRYAIDCAELRYIGSLGIQALIGLHNQVKGSGGVCVCNLAHQLREVFQITRIDHIITIHPSRKDAVDAIRGR